MIKFNTKHRFIEEIFNGINDLPVVKSVRNPKTLYVYGLSRERGGEVALPIKFPYSKELCSQFRDSIGLNANVSNHWGMAEAHNYQVIGLGFDMRKYHSDKCKRAVICAYLALNGIIDIKKPKQRRSSGVTLHSLQSAANSDF